MVKRPLLGVTILGFGLAVVCCQAIAGISDRELDPNWSKGTSPEDMNRRPPVRPEGDAGPAGGDTRTFVVTKTYLGTILPSTDDDDPNAWRAIGYDMDGLCTTAMESKSDNAGVCRKPEGASQLSLEDGDNCRDNAAGKLLASVKTLLSDDFEKQVNAKLKLAQLPSIILYLEDLGPGPDDPWVPGRIWVAAAHAPTDPPVWDGSDVFQVDSDSVSNNDLAKPKYSFPRGYLKNHVWVSNDFNAQAGAMPLMFLDRFKEMHTDATTLTVQLDPQHEKVVRSVLSAAISVAETESNFGPVVFDATCSQEITKQILDELIKPNVDLTRSGQGFVAADRTCDTLSVGMMFEWTPIRKPSNSDVVVVPPSESRCEDAGGDVGKDAGVEAGKDVHETGLPDADKLDTRGDG